MKLAVLGAGNMGMSYAEGIALKSGFIEKPILVLDNNEEKVAEVNQKASFKASINAEDLLPQADFILLAVKPQVFAFLATNIAPLLKKDVVVISIMAGVTIERIAELLQVQKVARAMPNLPASIGLGMTSVVFNTSINSDEKITVNNILGTTGKVMSVSNEEGIDKTTGISGSGPAYIFYFIEALEKAAQEMGFTNLESRELVSQTFLGAIELYRQNDLTPTEWMNRVASKGGTTRAALNKLEEEDVHNKIIKGAFAAFERAVELGKES